jgi:hypothetical protein
LHASIACAVQKSAGYGLFLHVEFEMELIALDGADQTDKNMN